MTTTPQNGLDSRIFAASRVRQVWWVALIVFLAVRIFMSAVPVDPSDLGANAATAGIVVKFSIVVVGLVAAISLLGWWRSVLRETTRAAIGWQLILVIPAAALVVAIAAALPAREFADVAVIVVVMVTGSIAEELLFRGVIPAGLRGSHVPEWLVWLASSAAFAVIHFSNIFVGIPVDVVISQVINAFLLGSLLYAARLLTGTLWVPIVLHVLNNLPVSLATDETAVDPLLNSAVIVAQVFTILSPVVLAVFFITRGILRRKGARTAVEE